MWARAARRLRLLQAAQVCLMLSMAGSILIASLVLGAQIRHADDDADRAVAHLAAVVEARDEVRQQENAFWRDRAAGGTGLTRAAVAGLNSGSRQLRELARAESGLQREDTTAAPRAAALSELAALDRLMVLVAAADARRLARTSAEGVMTRTGRRIDDWVAANTQAAAAATERARALVDRLMLLLVIVIGVLTAAALGVWLSLVRARTRVVGALSESERRLRALIQDLVLVVDDAGVVTYASPSATSILGYRDVELAGRSLAELCPPHESLDVGHLGKIADADGELVAGTLRRSDGSWLHVEILVSDLSRDPLIDGLVLNCRDVSERLDAEARLEHQAFHDALTDLPNRALFLDRLAHALGRSRRRSEPLAVLLLDLDDFKTINDSLGHAAGDQLLVGVAERISGALRAADTAARLGGDEFAVLLEGTASASHADTAAQRIADALAEPQQIDGHEIVTQASIGIALGALDSTPSTLLRQADIAMYAAKESGKGRQAEFHEALEASARRRMALRSELSGALDRNEFSMAYQPIVRLDTGEIWGVEALLRWNQPGRGSIAPAEFIPLAEESGLIRSIGAWVVGTACREAKRWEESLGSAAPAVSVNLSARQLDSPELPRLIEESLTREGLDPSRLVLEITETVLMGDVEAGRRSLQGLAALGVRVAIDDFGTGHSSLRYLGRLPVDIVKVDKSFVDSVASDSRDADLAAAILRASEAFGLDGVAEGVETAEQAAELARIGFPLAQGYHFSKPVEAEELLDALGSRLPAAAAVARR